MAEFALDDDGVVVIVGEDLPRAGKRVTLNTAVRDQWGLPVPNVHCDEHPNDIAMRAHAYERATALYEAVGARRVWRVPPFPSTHNLGTCRMSRKPADGVVNTFGQSHEIPTLFVADGSQFPTSAAENPTLSIVALALRQADYIAGQMKARAL